jgi:D-threo-aldose 1-dehydrogenase
VIAGVYNSGLLSSDRPAADAKYDYEDAPAELIARANAIADVCERHGATLPEAALAFALRHPAVVSVVVGARDATQVMSNIERYETTVPEAVWADLRAAALVSDSPSLPA